jgi:hypothetical protein
MLFVFPKIIAYGLSLALLLLNVVPAKALNLKQGGVLDYKVIIKSVIYGGDQTIKIINDKENYKGQSAIRVRSTVTTVGVVNKLIGFSEIEEMVLDVNGLYPLYLKRETRDSKGTEVEEVSFDYRKKIALRRLVKTNKPEKRTEIKLPGIVYDGLSLQFFLRKGELKPGNHQLYFYSNSGKIKDIDYSVREVKKKLQLENATYSEYVEVRSPKVSITILISNDEDRYPLVIRKLAKIGKFEAKLVKAF